MRSTTPPPEELKALPDNLDEIFDKHGDDIIIEDENGRNMHIYYLFGEHEGKKHYKCIKKDCNKALIVEMMKPEETIEPCPAPGAPKKKKRKSKKGKKTSKKTTEPQTSKEGEKEGNPHPQEEEK